MKHIILSMALLMVSSAAISETATHYELDVKEFSELKVVDGINVNYVCNADSAGKAVFTTTANLASVLMFSNNGGKLEMQIATDGINYRNLPTVTVYSNFLTRVENCGDSTVKVMNVEPCPRFKARLIGNGRLVVRNLNRVLNLEADIRTGNGTLVIDGSCDAAKYNTTGSGVIQADEMKANNVKCTLAGTGSIGCWVSDKLTIIGAGSGKVYYRGTPKEIKNHSIGVKAEAIAE